MKIELTISQTFTSAADFAAFAAGIAALNIGSAPGPYMVPPAGVPDAQAAMAALPRRATPVEKIFEAAAFESAPLSAAPATVDPDAHASEKSVPAPDTKAADNGADEKAKRGPGRPPKKERAPEPAAPVTPAALPAAGSFGGPAVVSAPATPAAAPVPPPASAAAGTVSLSDAKEYCLQFIGRFGDVKYKELLEPFQGPNVRRIGDMTPEVLAAFLAKLRSFDAANAK